MYQDSKYVVFHIYDVFLHLHRYLLLPHFRLELHFLPSNLHLHLHGNVSDSVIPVITLYTLEFKPSVSFGTNNLFQKSLSVIKLPTHLSNLTANGE